MSDSAEYCAYCGLSRSMNLENAREIATKSVPISLTLELPVVVPSVLRLSETTVRVVAAIIGVAAGLLSSLAIYMVADPSSMTGRLFNLREPSGAVPASTLVLFCWGLVICVVRYLRTSAAKRLSRDVYLVQSIDLARGTGLDNLAKELDLPATEYSPLLRRLRALTLHWSTTPGLQNADILLQQQLYSDEERLRAGYSLVRTFIWALPVMGLLGTVAGVAVAVGGFAKFLRGDIEDVAVIKLSLVNVTAGLSYAFLTTLYGLAGALILMFLVTALQNREEKLYSTIQERTANVFVPFLQAIAPETKGSGIVELSGLQDHLQVISASVLEYVRKQGAILLQSLVDERHNIHEDINYWSRLLREEATTGAENIGQALDRVGTRMTNAQAEFLQKFESIKTGMDQQAMSTLESISGAAQSVAVSQQQIVSALSEQQRVIEDSTQVLGKLSNVSQDSLKLLAEIMNTVTTFGDLELEKRADQIVHAVESQRKQLEASTLALNQTSALTNTMLTAQGSLQDSVSKLHDIGFEKTLREFRDSLVALKPVLEDLREPFILQAVPIKANGKVS